MWEDCINDTVPIFLDEFYFPCLDNLTKELMLGTWENSYFDNILERTRETFDWNI